MKIKIYSILFLICFLSYPIFSGVIFAPEEDGFGRQVLFIIAIDDYNYWPDLTFPVELAKDIRDILVSDYYIDEVYELYNKQATRANIMKVLASLKESLTADDSLLIYYGGHGHLDDISKTGALIPVNAKTDEYTMVNWLPNHILRGTIKDMNARHVLLISDSCFSGDILNIERAQGESPEPFDRPYFKNLYEHQSREVITAGGSEKVPDNSELSKQLKLCLKYNTNPHLDTLTIFNEIAPNVYITRPKMGDLKATDDQGGSFILFKKDVIQTVLILIAADSGTLFINSDFFKNLEPNEKIHMEVKPGEYNIEVHYISGEIESCSVMVEKGQTEEVVFTGISPTPEPTEKPAPEIVIDPVNPVPTETPGIVKSKRKEENYLSTAAGFGLTIPLGDASELTEPGYKPLACFHYNIVNDWGVIGIGFVSGTGIESTKEEIIPGYNLYAIPIAASIKYTTNFDTRLNSYIGITGGVNIYIATYESESIDNIVFPVPFVEPVIGIGYNFIPEFGISVFGSVPVKIYQDYVFIGIVPGMMIEINY